MEIGRRADRQAWVRWSLALLMTLLMSCAGASPRRSVIAPSATAISSQGTQSQPLPQLVLDGPTPSMGKLVLPLGFIVSSPANRQSAQEWVLVERHETDEMVNLVFTRGGQPQDLADQVITVRWWYGHLKLDPEAQAKKSAAWMKDESGNCLYGIDLSPNPAYQTHAVLYRRHHAQCDRNRYPAEWFQRPIDSLQSVSGSARFTFKDPTTKTERAYALTVLRDFRLVQE